MDRRGAFSFVGPVALWGCLLSGVVFHAEGIGGFKPLANLEALFLVLSGTALCLCSAYPARDVWRAVSRAAAGNPSSDEEEARVWVGILRHGADSAVGMGAASTLLGMILMLSAIDDISAVPRRMALSLAAALYGLLLSEAIFVPLARRVRGPDLTLRLPTPDGGRRRMAIGLGAVGSSALSFFVILYALSAAVAKDLRPSPPLDAAVLRVGVRLPTLSLECEPLSMTRADAEALVPRLHWARAKDFRSVAYARTFSVGEEFILETAKDRGSRCLVRPLHK